MSDENLSSLEQFQSDIRVCHYLEITAWQYTIAVSYTMKITGSFSNPDLLPFATIAECSFHLSQLSLSAPYTGTLTIFHRDWMTYGQVSWSSTNDYTLVAISDHCQIFDTAQVNATEEAFAYVSALGLNVTIMAVIANRASVGSWWRSYFWFPINEEIYFSSLKKPVSTSSSSTSHAAEFPQLIASTHHEWYAKIEYGTCGHHISRPKSHLHKPWNMSWALHSDEQSYHNTKFVLFTFCTIITKQLV